LIDSAAIDADGIDVSSTGMLAVRANVRCATLDRVEVGWGRRGRGLAPAKLRVVANPVAVTSRIAAYAIRLDALRLGPTILVPSVAGVRPDLKDRHDDGPG
jgi:hypothetical protein